MKVTENKRKEQPHLVNISTAREQLRLFKAHVLQYEQDCLEYLNRPETTEEQAEVFIAKTKERVQLLNKAIELAKREVEKIIKK